MSVITPDSFEKRCLTYRLHDAIEYIERDSSTVVHAYSESETRDQLSQCALLDLSALKRTGLRGKNARQVLVKEGLPFPDKPNQLIISEDGVLVARLGSTECWMLDNPIQASSGLGMIDIRATNEPDCYPLYCQHTHAWFALTGKNLPELMAKVCGVDLREASFPLGAIAQTSVARVGAIILHHEVEGIPVFSILSDSSSAEYLWHALLDAMQEFDGKPVGFSAFS